MFECVCAFERFTLLTPYNMRNMRDSDKIDIFSCDTLILVDTVTQTHEQHTHTHTHTHRYAEDVTPRFLTRSLHLDYDTMFGADKFGNVFDRVPDKVNDDEGAATGSGMTDLLWRTSTRSNSQKLKCVVNFHTGELTTSLVKTSLANGSQEVVLAGGVNGGLRVFMPLPSTSDVEFLTHLEMHMRIEAPSLAVVPLLSKCWVN